MKKTLLLISLVTTIIAQSHAGQTKFMFNQKPFTLNQGLGLMPSAKRAAFSSRGDGAFGEGTIAITVGYGVLSGGLTKTLLKAYDDESDYSFKSFGPLHIKAEYGLSEMIGLGISVNHNSWAATWRHTGSNNHLYYDEFKRSVTSVLARMNIHFGVKEKLDPYWGIAAGYRIASYTQTSTDPDYDFESFTSPLNVGFETTLGLRYYFTDNIGVYGEIGLAQSVLQLGLAVKF